MIFETFFFVGVVAVLARALAGIEERAQVSTSKRQASPRVVQALDYADRLYAAKRFHAAEKAYLDVLKLDHKNLAAYNHLGTIYSQLKNYPDAIECFQIATQLSPSATTYHSLGLVYYENHDYAKAVIAYEKSIMFEPSASRYVALSKAYHRTNNLSQMITALEQAVALNPHNPRLLKLLLDGYVATKDREKAHELTKRLQLADGQKLENKS